MNPNPPKKSSYRDPEFYEWEEFDWDDLEYDRRAHSSLEWEKLCTLEKLTGGG